MRRSEWADLRTVARDLRWLIEVEIRDMRRDLSAAVDDVREILAVVRGGLVRGPVTVADPVVGTQREVVWSALGGRGASSAAESVPNAHRVGFHAEHLGVCDQLAEVGVDSDRGVEVLARAAERRADRTKLLAARVAEKFGEEALDALLSLGQPGDRVCEVLEAVAELDQRGVSAASAGGEEVAGCGSRVGAGQVGHGSSPSAGGSADSVGERPVADGGLRASSATGPGWLLDRYGNPAVATEFWRPTADRDGGS